MAVTYPIGEPVDGGRLDPAWGINVTQGVNDHQTRLATVETLFVPQVSWSMGTTLATTANSLGAEAAMASWAGAAATFLFRAGWVHECTVQIGVSENGTGGSAGRVVVRIRKGMNTTAGQQLAFNYINTRGADSVVNSTFTRYVKNATAADISTQCGLTVMSSAGGGQAKLYGDSDTPAMLTVKPLGLSASLTGFASVAASIV